VSEFQHKLLDWLEEAFKPGSGGEESPPQRSGEGDGSEPMEVDSESPDHKDNSNPMVKLFFGKVKATGSNAGTQLLSSCHSTQCSSNICLFPILQFSVCMSMLKITALRFLLNMIVW